MYIIEDITSGKAYVGRKNVWLAKSKKGCKSRVTDRSSEKWKEECWKESDWKEYSGSSKNLLRWIKDNPDHEYKYTVLKCCSTKGRLSYEEAKEQWKREVLEATLPDGTYKYFNGNIQAIRFRPKEEL